MASMPPAEISSGGEVGRTLGEAGLQVVAPHLLGLLGDEHDRQPAVGELGGGLDAVAHERRPPDRDVVAHGWLISFSGLPSPVPSPSGSGTVDRLAVVVDAPRGATIMRQTSMYSLIRCIGFS